MQHFLIIYSHKNQTLISAPRVFSDDQVDAATAAYQESEAEYRDSSDVEIVLIGADSIETIQRTHGHYFASVGDRLARYLTPA
jgi:hypothetical protein